MMGGGAGGALMYLIFDPEMEDFPEARAEIEEYVFNIGQTGEWKSQNFSFDGRCLQMKLATHSTVKI